MATTDIVKQDYNQSANLYNDYALTPNGILETQLLDSVLRDCTNLSILDLGGGTGLRARQALSHGAKLVDVIDISPEMLHIGQAIERSSSHQNLIKYHEADCSKPLDHKVLDIQAPGSYDIVMANWLFDHASSISELEGMWSNISTYLKPSTGLFIGVRCGDIKSPAAMSGKYGIVFKDWMEIEGGYRFRYRAATKPPIEIEAASMEVSFGGSWEMHERFGLVDAEVVDCGGMEVVRGDREFWGEFLERPFMVVVKGRKKEV